VRDLPDMLVAGREREFLTWFHNNEAVNSRAFTNEAEETYARAYSMPGRCVRASNTTGPSRPT
jgi:hypothetical protein